MSLLGVLCLILISHRPFSLPSAGLQKRVAPATALPPRKFHGELIAMGIAVSSDVAEDKMTAPVTMVTSAGHIGRYQGAGLARKRRPMAKIITTSRAGFTRFLGALRQRHSYSPFVSVV